MANKNFRKSSGRIKSLKTIELPDEVAKFQYNVVEAFTNIASVEILNGVLLKQVELVTGQDNNVNHKLGREPQGYIIVRKRANSNIWDSQDTNKFKDLTLVLNCSANVTVDLWIF
jgi:predicted Zn-dependent protease with MMP-like domain